MLKVIRHGGHYAEIGFDDSADQFHGRVVGIDDVVDFYGASVEELRREFAESVAAYEAACAEAGRAPEKAWAGKTTLRADAEQRRRYAVAAAAEGKSLNDWMVSALDEAAARTIAGIPDIG